ncbi:bi-domain-containing oxidoreductase [Pseudomonas otitidis]|uniref:bi-domain-containing oxidoreductase n=1 Tax=Metapseudomonas otitidis TaxID=319939 RepID=UPI00244B2575|nr:bi-domain-containing oxidoreductase [Pseudomonas otitidis]MDH1109239.1 bi-domain-containing oxidoreductase [Pseudomonas otitidis]MDH1159993.1 bi-domain-containing oxidoreductase [Pseudomonas otitidis]MDH1167399.1 bi-domain-containing oxidoreductase [Pseudomonas otitidis]
MKQLLLKQGAARLEDVPAPLVGSKHVLVHVQFSCVSVGTEAASVVSAAEPLYKRALKHPEKIRRAFDMVREQGLARTIERVRGTLSAGQPTGYSAAGTVVAVGDLVEGFKVGDRVACAGAGIANHAEFINVPVNLVVTVPAELPSQHAATVTLGAIALQGVRRTAPTLGETIMVVGLGVLGQLAVQLFKANGCRVIGVDPDPRRLEVARRCGMDLGVDPIQDDQVSRVAWMTDGLGADAVVVTAASASSDLISLAMRACRKKGRVVLVGDVGLDLKREDFYRKELDFLISTSYGPGRYDPNYEEEGQDYPLAYVRWTENRNMAAYLELLEQGKVDLQALSPEIVDLAEAEALYARLAKGQPRPLLALLRYPVDVPQEREHSLMLRQPARGDGRIRVAVIGAGGFAQGMHLPNLVRLRERYEIRWIVSRTGSTAKAAATQFGASFAGTDYCEALADPDVDLVLIATRHHLHGVMAREALEAGKHVLIEKPLALLEDEIAAIEAFYANAGACPRPLLMTGFNRRHSPGIVQLKAMLGQRSAPMMISYRMNAGYLSPDHWVHGPEGGGRNIGEACHIYDLFAFLTDAEPISVEATAIGASAGGIRGNENFTATIRYSDGSVASLLYTSLGAASHPKERMDIYTDGKVLSLDDYRTVSVSGDSARSWTSPMPQKGQYEELVALADAIGSGVIDERNIRSQLATTRLALAIEKQLQS